MNDMKKFLILVSQAYKLFKYRKRTPYRIEEFNIQNNQVVIQCRGAKAIVKISFEEAISEEVIIDGLPPMQACWLGYHYAKNFHFQKKNNKTPPQIEYSLRSSGCERFQIISFKNRRAELNYFDNQQEKMITRKVAEVAQDESILNSLHPSHACYVGMLTGYEVVKRGVEILTKRPEIPVLKVVR